MKTFKGKAIYNPSGKAGEYSYWACNFYVGCSNGCEYCYCKKDILAGSSGNRTFMYKHHDAVFPVRLGPSRFDSGVGYAEVFPQRIH